MKTTLGYDRAIELMRRPEVRLVQMHGRATGFYILPGGGPVERTVADKIIAHPFVRAGRDGLFPNHSQTWRMEVA